MSIPENKLNSAWWALRVGLGAVPFLAGLDKFFNLLTNWEMYLSPSVERLLPVSGTTFMHIVGVIEMIVGLTILTRWTRIGSYVAMLWLVLIAVNLISSGIVLGRCGARPGDGDRGLHARAPYRGEATGH